MHDALLNRIHELRDLAGVINLATWDQETYMPRKAEAARASQLSTLQGLYHERLVDPRVGEWLASLTPSTADEQALVRVLTRERDRAVKLPSSLVKALAEAQSHALGAWREAREQQAFRLFQPKLETLVRLRREQADALGHDGERYDALLEGYEPGMRVARLSPVLSSLVTKLEPLVAAIEAKGPPRDVFAGKRFPVDAQWAFTVELLGALGFDLDAGRQDRSIHPFSSGLSATDVRLTTRLSDTQPLSAIFGTIHECGHGLYEQGFSPSDARTPLAQSPSMGLHESQSRLWENLVGRSRPFWTFFYPRLVARFPQQLGGVDLDDFLASVNRVERSFVRVEADEVTYNLHIALRYELELGLVRGTLSVADAEAAWNEKTKRFLGLTVTKPTDGVLQDIHWAWGEFGYFPTYALGNLYGATLFAAARRARPGLDGELAAGTFDGLLSWLREHVHRPGARLDAEDLVRQATGHGLRDDDFIAALQARYG
ncbi:MAG: carboxypeptidase M32 [Myxococcaceae bacterium]|jgi:carboxypeptidase Taq|nr:carboxypeptidase M32 [Myxococcaceae bacterium]